MNRILVVGATGNIGGEVASQLAAVGARVRALVRNRDTSQVPSGVEAMEGDLALPDTLGPCLSDIDAVFLVWTAPRAAFGPAFERIAKHARRIVFLSAPIKTPHPFFQQPNPARDTAEEIERAIESSGLEWTFLRPGMLAVNARVWWARAIQAGEPVRWPYLDVHTAPIHERDIAAVAVKALLEGAHHKAEYVLTGPQSLTQREQIETVGRVIGRPVPVQELSPDEARHVLSDLFNPEVADMLLAAWSAGAGLPAFVTSTVRDLTGKPARTFAEWVSDHAPEFQPSELH
jgi:uncharacterized protein YbjT (DUF2867 family)